MRRALSAVLLVAMALSAAAHARAQDADAGVEGRELPTLGAAERTAAAPLLQRGVLVMAPTAYDEQPAALAAIRVAAPVADVAALLSSPEGYPAFVAVLDTVHVTGRRGTSLSYDWTWRNAALEMHGTNQLDVFAPPRRRPDAGWRFAIRSTAGDLGRGRLQVRVLPDGPQASLVTVASRLDVEQATYVAREIGGGGRTLNRAVNVAISTLIALGIRRAATHGARPTAAVHPEVANDAALAWPGPDPSTLAPLLASHDVVLVELDASERLERITALARTGTRQAAVHAALHDPSYFGDALVPGSRSTPEGTEGTATRFVWTVDVPFVGATAHMRLRDLGAGVDGVAIDGVTGGLHDGRWRIEQYPQGPSDSIVAASARFDVSDTGWLIRVLAGGSHDLAIGLTASCELMVARAVRSGAASH